MTTLSTHDTKRSEDVRARLAALSELTTEWTEAVRGWWEASSRYRSGDGWPSPATGYLIWQTLIGTWDGGPLALDRLQSYLAKATREAKLLTSWTDPEPDYHRALAEFAAAVLADTDLIASIGAFCDRLADPARVAVLGQKLLQLTMPGVPDVYQGCEGVALTLVDPDNRGVLDVTAHRAALARLDAGGRANTLSEEKLLVTSRALRLRRDHPGWFAGAGSGYAPVATTTGNAVAFARGPVSGDGGAPLPRSVTVATRLPVALQRHGGWGEHTVTLPVGHWLDVLTGRRVPGGSLRLADLLTDLPVALLAAEP